MGQSNSCQRLLCPHTTTTTTTSTTPRFPTSQRLSMVCRSVDTATPPPSGGGLCSTLQCYRAPKICTVLTRTVCTRPKKNYLKVLVQIFFDCSLVDLFINLCVIICDKI